MKSSLRTQLFSQNMLFSTLLLFFIGGYLAIFLFQQDIRTTHTLVQNQNKAINLFIEGYFNEIKHNVDFLAADINVQNGDIKGKGYRKKALHIYKQLQNSNSNIYFVFSGYQGKGLLINNYTAPKGYMMEKRPWYKAAVNSFPHLSIGEPYQDITFKDWLVATSKALSRNGKIYGVVSIDCSTDNIISALQRGAGPTQEFESFVINKKGQIIIHPNSNLIGKKIGDIFSENLLLNKEQGYIETAHKNLALFIAPSKATVGSSLPQLLSMNLKPLLSKTLSPVSPSSLFFACYGATPKALPSVNVSLNPLLPLDAKYKILSVDK